MVCRASMVVMADSEAVRSARYRRHRRGNHEMCLHPLAESEDQAAEVDPGQIDPVAVLRSVVVRLMAVSEAEPRNVPIAHELRMAVSELARLEPPAPPSDPLDVLREMMDGVP